MSYNITYYKESGCGRTGDGRLAGMSRRRIVAISEAEYSFAGQPRLGFFHRVGGGMLSVCRWLHLNEGVVRGVEGGVVGEVDRLGMVVDAVGDHPVCRVHLREG